MRKAPPGIVLSAAVHAALVAWVATRGFTPSLPSETTSTTPIEIEIKIVVIDKPPIAPIVPMEDALAAEPPSPPAVATARPPTAPPTPSRSRAPSEHADGAIAALPGAGSADETAPRPPARSSWMSMHRGDVPRPALLNGRWDDLDHVPRGTAPEKALTTGQLHESGGGTYKSEQGVFVAKVNPDGSVKLTDSPNLHVRLALPSPRALGRSLASWYDSDKGPYGAEGDTAMAKQLQVSSGATTDPADPVTPRVKDRATTAIVPVLAGGFDITDWLMRRHGQDPYAHKKLAFLDATRDERAQIGNRHRAGELARSPVLVQKNLDALWAAIQTPHARKQALFELWDECAETGEDSVVAAGQAARRLVIGFIRAHLPAGSADAYTPAELARLARTRQSKAAFQPYE